MGLSFEENMEKWKLCIWVLILVKMYSTQISFNSILIKNKFSAIIN